MNGDPLKGAMRLLFCDCRYTSLPKCPRLMKYNMLGHQPVWIFRLENHTMFSHGEHGVDGLEKVEVKKTN